MDAERHESAPRVEVRRVELKIGDDADGEHWNRRFPDDHDRIAVRQKLCASKVDRGEHNHQDHGDDEPGSVEEAGARAHLVDHVEVHVHPADAIDVGDRGKHFDWRDEHCLKPRCPSGGKASDGAVRIVGEPRAGTGDGVCGAELCVHKRKQRQHRGRENPRQDRRGAGHFGRIQCTKKPARPDDRAERDEHEAVEADVAPQLPCGRARVFDIVSAHPSAKISRQRYTDLITR